MNKFSFFIGFLFLFISACDDGGQGQFLAEMNQAPTGITRTDKGGDLLKDAQGKVIEEDKTDWRTAPYYFGHIRFNPLFPNPTKDGFVTISFVITATDVFRNGIIIRGYNDNDNKRFVVLDQVDRTAFAGAYSFNFDIAKLSASGTPSSIKGIHRLFIMDRLTSEPIGYGDLLVE